MGAATCPNGHGAGVGCPLCTPCGGGQDTCDETMRYVCSRHFDDLLDGDDEAWSVLA